MGAPQAHGIPSPLLLAAELKRSNLKKVHTTFHPTAFVNQQPAWGESASRAFLSPSSLRRAASKRGTKLLSTRNPASHFVATNEAGFGLSLVGPSALESGGEW